jgi:hypothetical protein
MVREQWVGEAWNVGEGHIVGWRVVEIAWDEACCVTVGDSRLEAMNREKRSSIYFRDNR